ncbi:MAG: DUF484 family protein [Gammaproteobacteria bacterium]
MSEQQAGLTSELVEAYLLQHPEFFNEHLHLLEKMSIPHPSGNAISLISKQLEIFRIRHHELENQLSRLIEIARENDVSFQRMHKLTLSLLDAISLNEIAAKLDQMMSDYFMTDFVALRIIKSVPIINANNLFLDPASESIEPFSQELASFEPKCGRPTLAQAKILFGDSALDVKSCAIIPLRMENTNGLLGIGSKQEGRFHYSMGNLFLVQMGEIISARIASLLPALS